MPLESTDAIVARFESPTIPEDQAKGREERRVAVSSVSALFHPRLPCGRQAHGYPRHESGARARLVFAATLTNSS